MIFPPRIDVLGIRIDPLTFDEAVELVLKWMSEEDCPGRYIVTPNVNHIVLHRKNELFRDAYAKASLVLADGRYVIFLSKLLGQRLPEAISGSDLVPALFEGVKRGKRITVFFLGALDGVAELAAAKVTKRWPAIKIAGTYSPPFGFENSDVETMRIRSIVNEATPDLLVVGVSPPKQEIWLAQNIEYLNIKVGICAGATIDFLAGAVRRAPYWMQRAGLEWVFRVLMEPRRLVPRYTNDGIVVSKLLISEFCSRRRNQS